MRERSGVFVVGFVGGGVFGVTVRRCGDEQEPSAEAVHRAVELFSGYEVAQLAELDANRLGLAISSDFVLMVAVGCKTTQGRACPTPAGSFSALIDRMKYGNLAAVSSLLPVVEALRDLGPRESAMLLATYCKEPFLPTRPVVIPKATSHPRARPSVYRTGVFGAGPVGIPPRGSNVPNFG